mmetsp:Transcript_6026/g.6466  ORF Transcript_6026/g.6466 Transcript_6026/m.6466 type:complete len:248 (-) Transcript_6026:76-819(-)
MPLATYTVDDGDVPVGVLILDDGKMNSFDFTMIREVNEALDKAEKDSTKALVIAGTAKALSAGFDIKTMAAALGKGGSKEDSLKLVEQGGRLMMKMFAFPKPVIVAATGHSLALGAIILLAADTRIGSKASKSKIGLNETAINLQLPEFGWRLAQYRLSAPHFTRAVTQGMVYNLADAVAVGYLDELVEGDAIVGAVAEARRIGGYVKQPAFSRMKSAERTPLVTSVLDNIKENIANCLGGGQASKL